MVKRNVVWTKTAEIQFIGILEYWARRNKTTIYSKKLLHLVAKKTSQIALTPLINKLTDFKDVRVASMGNFSIYYKVTEELIIVTAFWDNRQDYTKLLKILQGK